MMLARFPAIISVAFTLCFAFAHEANAAAANSCEMAFKPSPDSFEALYERKFGSAHDAALKLARRQHFREKRIGWYRIANGRSEKQTAARERFKLEKLENHLNYAQEDAAFELYQEVWEDVELAYFRITEINEVKKAAKRDGVEINPVRAKKIDDDLKYSAKRLSRARDQYIMAKTLLEETIEQNQTVSPVEIRSMGLELRGLEAASLESVPLPPPIAVKTARNVLARLTAINLRKSAPDLDLPNRPPTVDEVLELYETTPGIRSFRQSRQAWVEFATTLRFLVTTQAWITAAERMIKFAPVQYHEYLQDWVKVMGGQTRLWLRYGVESMRVKDVPNGPAERLHLLEQINAKFNETKNDDEFLITFARYVEIRPHWKILKREAIARAQSDPNDAFFRVFAERMQKAEEAAIEKGDLSLIDDSAPIESIGVITGSVATIGATILATHWPF